MQITKVEVYSQESNAGVVRLPGRRFPGMVVQGDSLAVLCDLVKGALGASEADRTAALTELESRLTAYQRAYERVLKAHDIELPYSAGESTPTP